MSVLKILLGCAFCLWVLLLWRRRKYYMFMLKVPGPIGLPLVGVLYKVKSLEGGNPFQTFADGLEKKNVQIFFDLAIDLMRSGKFTAKNVEDHANNIVFGAFETTATTITHALIFLAMNPQYQEIAFEEIFTLYSDSDNVTVTEEDLQHLVYLDMVINETMRLIPTVPLVARTATADVALSSGVVVPSGTQICVGIFDLHRHKSIWGPNALVFNPENFLPENMRNKHPYAFIPFTKGIRSCIDMYQYTRELVKTYKSPMFSWVGPIPVFVTWDPQTAQDILTSPHCVNRAHLYGPMREVLGNGLLTLANPEWHVHRKMLNPALSIENLRSFLPIFNEKTIAFVKDFEISYDGASVSILPMMQKLTLYITLQTTMGLKRDRHTNDDDKEERLFNFYRYFGDKVIAMGLMPWLRFGFVRKFVPSFKAYTRRKIELQKLFENEIEKKMKLLSTTDKTNMKFNYTQTFADGLEKKNVQIFFDLAIDLMRSGKFTAKNVEDHANNIVFGAFETTATTITHALIFLAMNPQYQEIAFEEIFTLYSDSDNVTVTEEDLQHLVYLDMVINETMRLIPTVPFVARTATADVALSSGVVVPSGTQICVGIFDLHRHKSIWGPNALVFNPENFLPENMRNKHPYAFIPFTKGIRSCIGWRYGLNATKVVLTILLRKYHFTTNSKFEDFRYSPAITSKLIDPPLLQLHLREK